MAPFNLSGMMTRCVMSRKVRAASWSNVFSILCRMPIKYDDVNISRIFLNGVDSTIEENTLMFQLPVPVKDCIYLELVSASDSLLNKLIQIDGWGENVTSKGRLYWRYIDSTSNQRFADWQTTDTVYRKPQTLRNLTLSLWYPDGTSAPLDKTDSNNSIEIAVYSLRQ